MTQLCLEIKASKRRMIAMDEASEREEVSANEKKKKKESFMMR